MRKSIIREGIGLAGIAVDTEETAGGVKPTITSTENIATGTVAVGTGSVVTLEWLKDQYQQNQEVIQEGLTGLSTQGTIQIVYSCGYLYFHFGTWLGGRGEASFLRYQIMEQE